MPPLSRRLYFLSIALSAIPLHTQHPQGAYFAAFPGTTASQLYIAFRLIPQLVLLAVKNDVEFVIMVHKTTVG